MNGWHKRLMAWLLAILWLGMTPGALAEAIIYEEPRIPADANEYDPEHPENLDGDQLYAKAAILIEESSGEIIFEKNTEQVMYPASTTKIMTVLLAIMMGDMEDTVTISQGAVDLPEGASTAKFQAGEEVNMLDLLYATMLMSANEGATAIAEHISGSVQDFADLMNRTAQVFGCTSTNFVNANGLHDANHYTTARDMAIITREAMKYSLFRQICAVSSYTLPKTNLTRSRTLSNTQNVFMVQSETYASYYYSYATGVKTGYTDAAGYCYVGSANKDGVSLISVVFYSTARGRFRDTKRLMEYGFSRYVSTSPLKLYQMNPITIETTGFSLEDSNRGRLQLNIEKKDPAQDDTVIVTSDQEDYLARNLRELVVFEYTRDFAAPITYGEQIGTMTYFTDSGEAIEYVLTAGRSIEKRTDAPKTIEEIEAETYADPNPFPPITVEFVLMLMLPVLGVILVIWLLRKLFGHRTGRGGKVPRPIRRYFR